MSKCEHCGSDCYISPVCCECGRDHTKLWLEEQYRNRASETKCHLTFWLLWLLHFPVLVYAIDQLDSGIGLIYIFVSTIGIMIFASLYTYIKQKGLQDEQVG